MLRKTAISLLASMSVFLAVAPAFSATIIVTDGRRHHRHHCWIERQKVVVHGRHGPRVHWRNVRVCR